MDKYSTMSCWAVFLITAVFGFNGFNVLADINYETCIQALGMESGTIKDEDITASSSFDSGNVGPQHGRIRTEKHGGAWCPKQPATPEPKEYIEINLRHVHVITAVETQGRFGNGQGQEYTETYQLEYWRPKLGKWVRYRNYKGEEVLDGNENTYLEVKRFLNPAIWASRIRFVPYSFHRRTICMRVELYGCRWNEGLVSYSMPQGDKRGMDWEFFDITYDGYWDDELKRGLGQLTDGKFGPDYFRPGHHKIDDDTKNQGWVGWKSETRNNNPIEIKFEFDRVREFLAVHVYTSNQFTKEIQVFSKAEVTFSVGGKTFSTDPITYVYMEDKVFENSRNVTIKLHHRIGRFANLKLHFSNKWIMISEVIFDSEVAQGNFSADINEVPVRVQTNLEKDESIPLYTSKPAATSVSTRIEEQTYMTIIICMLIAVIVLLTVIIYCIMSRLRKRNKGFASPLAAKSTLADNVMQQHCSTESSFGTYSAKDGGGGTASSSSVVHHPIQKDSSAHLINRTVKIDDYQEPYQALKYAPYYSYSSVIMEMRDSLGCSYEYAVPEMGTIPLLGPEITTAAQPPIPPAPGTIPPSLCKSDTSSRSYSSDENKKKKLSSQQQALNALKHRLGQSIVPEFPRHRIRMLSKISEGTYGTVYIAEADGIPEYGVDSTVGKRLVGVKFLCHNASQKERVDFHRDVKILAALEDVNIARVLGICTTEEPLCVIMEYLEHGDLNQFLKTHIPAECAAIHPPGIKTLSFNCLLYMASQIASGMRYLESLNFVHRDLSTRNCIVGKAYHVKISDYATDNELYAQEYYDIGENTTLPVRWMSWEAVFLGKYTTKSDIWSFGVTFWEILTMARELPYDELTDKQVTQNLAYLQDGSPLFSCLPKPNCCNKDIYDLMLECWKRNEIERPSFREIHLFLQRKNLGYAPVP